MGWRNRKACDNPESAFPGPKLNYSLASLSLPLFPIHSHHRSFNWDQLLCLCEGCFISPHTLIPSKQSTSSTFVFPTLFIFSLLFFTYIFAFFIYSSSTTLLLVQPPTITIPTPLSQIPLLLRHSPPLVGRRPQIHSPPPSTISHAVHPRIKRHTLGHSLISPTQSTTPRRLGGQHSHPSDMRGLPLTRMAGRGRMEELA